MRMFERLRGRDRCESNVERKLLETITGDLIRRIEDVTEVTVLPESKQVIPSRALEIAPAQVPLGILG